eukprot:1329953-Rhodomonas_salina.1
MEVSTSPTKTSAQGQRKGRLPSIQAVKPRAPTLGLDDVDSDKHHEILDDETAENEPVENEPAESAEDEMPAKADHAIPIFQDAWPDHEQEERDEEDRFLSLHTELSAMLRQQERMRPTQWSVELPSWSWKAPTGPTFYKLASLHRPAAKNITPWTPDSTTPAATQGSVASGISTVSAGPGRWLNGSWPPKQPLLPKM